MKTHVNAQWMQPESWQRVVDGELNQAQLSELITACEQHPELWKLCAVAFLEEQALAFELRELTARWPASPGDALGLQSVPSQSDDWLTNVAACLDITAPSPADASFSAERAMPPEQPGARAPNRRASLDGALRSHRLNHLGLAASVMLAFLIGWQASQRFGRLNSLNSAAEANQDAVAGNSSITQRPSPPARAAESDLATSDLATSNVQLNEGPSRDSVAQPSALIDTTPSVEIAAQAIGQALQRPEQFVPLDRRIPKQLAELERRGFVRIESIEGFVPIRLRDGNTAVVPVQQIDLRPVRNAY